MANPDGLLSTDSMWVRGAVHTALIFLMSYANSRARTKVGSVWGEVESEDKDLLEVG